MEQIARLQAWFASKCDGEWEHGPGLLIGTLDNPGWRIELPEAVDERLSLVADRQDGDPDDGDDWLHVSRVKPGIVGIYCGPHRLADALEVFLRAVGH